jgi:ribonuclease BN (tRNA processing enzyme)
VSELIFVGTSDAFGSGGRRQSAYLVRTQHGGALLDCGATTCTGLSALNISRCEIDAIVVSHFHADHFGGIPPFLLASMYEDERREPLRIAGPPGVERRVRNAARALGHPIENHDWSFRIEFVELEAGKPRETGPIEVTPFETHHQPEANPHGFTIAVDGRTLAYSGDTGWFDELPRRVAGSELFICECTQVLRDYPFHLSLEELSERRDDFDCGALVLTHLGPAMRELREYNGFDVADDGRVIRF